MTTQATNTIPIVVRIPAELGLTKQATDMLENKWLADLTKAAGGGGAAKLHWHITLHIEVGDDGK